jgi:nucleoside-triphosphatase THEP1
MNRIILITGEKKSGKTSYVKYFIEQVAIRKNLPYAGFITEGIFKSGQLTGYDLIDITHLNKKRLCSNIPRKGWFRMGHFYFDPDGLHFADQVLSNLPRGTQWVLIDEYVPLEISGKGWIKSLDQLMKNEGLNFMITVRPGLLTKVIEKYQGHEIHVFNIRQSDFTRITTALNKLVFS